MVTHFPPTNLNINPRKHKKNVYCMTTWIVENNDFMLYHHVHYFTAYHLYASDIFFFVKITFYYSVVFFFFLIRDKINTKPNGQNTDCLNMIFPEEIKNFITETCTVHTVCAIKAYLQLFLKIIKQLILNIYKIFKSQLILILYLKFFDRIT